jgi:hypothetical protein
VPYIEPEIGQLKLKYKPKGVPGTFDYKISRIKRADLKDCRRSFLSPKRGLEVQIAKKHHTEETGDTTKETEDRVEEDDDAFLM